METWLEWAKGPLFWTAFAFMVLGLARHAGLTLWEAVRVYRRAGDRKIPGRRVTRDTLRWLVPVDRVRNRPLYSATTVIFHVAVIAVPLFLAGHVALVEKGIGLSWPVLPNGVATTLTLAAVAAAVAIVLQRAVNAESRALSRFQDYAMPIFIGLVFLTGFLAVHPAWNPFPGEAMLLTHFLAGDLLLLLVPLSKLSHMVLLPLTQLVSELAWHFPPDAGVRVGVSLGKENEPV